MVKITYLPKRCGMDYNRVGARTGQRVYPAKINPITTPPPPRSESRVREHPNSDLRFSCQQLIIVKPLTQTTVAVYERRSFTRASVANYVTIWEYSHVLDRKKKEKRTFSQFADNSPLCLNCLPYWGLAILPLFWCGKNNRW